MSMKSIRDYYGVPAKRGGRVRYLPSNCKAVEGTILSARGSHLMVVFDGEKRRYKLHPTWKIEYLFSIT